MNNFLNDSIAYYNEHATLPVSATPFEKVMWQVGKLASLKVGMQEVLTKFFNGNVTSDMRTYSDFIRQLFSISAMTRLDCYQNVTYDGVHDLNYFIKNFLLDAKNIISDDYVAVADRCYRANRFNGFSNLLYSPSPKLNGDWQIQGTSLENCFYNCAQLISVPFNENNPHLTQNVTNFRRAFNSTISLKTDLVIDASSATNFYEAFTTTNANITILNMQRNNNNNRMLYNANSTYIKGINIETEYGLNEYGNCANLETLELAEGSYIVRNGTNDNDGRGSIQYRTLISLNVSSLLGIIDHLYDWRTPSNNVRQYSKDAIELSSDIVYAKRRCLMLSKAQEDKLNDTTDPNYDAYWLKKIHAKGWFAQTIVSANGSTTEEQNGTINDLYRFLNGGYDSTTIEELYNDDDYLNP